MSTSTTQQLIADMEDAWRQVTNAPRRPVYILTRALTHARKSRRWRGKRFVFRGLHDELCGVLR